MLKKLMLLSIILTFQGCVKNYTHPEIELVKFNQDSSYYYITFLSDINFSTRKSSKNTGSYVHCINDSTIYDDEYIPDFSTNHYLNSNIHKDIEPNIDKTSNRYIYNIRFERSSTINYNKAIYCRVFTGSFPGKLKKSQVFEITQKNNQ